MGEQVTTDQGGAEGAGFGFTRAQVKAFAAGLYHLAACDGVDEREVAIIAEFVRDAGCGDLADVLPSLDFDPVQAYQLFESSWLRGLFLRAALLVIKSDGSVSEQEIETLDFMAEAFGIQGGYEGLLAQVEGQSLS